MGHMYESVLYQVIVPGSYSHPFMVIYQGIYATHFNLAHDQVEWTQ